MSTPASLLVAVVAGSVPSEHEGPAGTRSAAACAMGTDPQATAWNGVPTGQVAGTVTVRLSATPDRPGLSGPLFVQVIATAPDTVLGTHDSSACTGGATTVLPTGR